MPVKTPWIGTIWKMNKTRPQARDFAQTLAASSVAVTEAAASGVIGMHAVDGMAGIGKTAFAVHAAHQLADRFRTGRSSFPCMRIRRGGSRSTPLGRLKLCC